MATLILSTAGSAIGTALGGPIGGVIGQTLGAAAGGAIDGALLSGRGSPRHVEGPRLADVAGLSSTEGDPVPRVYGRARIGGTLIWATRPLEVANTAVERAGTGAKGGGGQRTVRTAYAYFANLAVGLCEGEIAGVRRIWADGRELDQTGLTLRVHRGGAGQAPDPLVVAKEGAENAPAYRGLAYVVFEGLPLADFGNRIPQFAFEVVRPVNGLAPLVRAVDLIPGASEFALDPNLVTVDLGFGRTRPANRHQIQAATDVTASLDALQALCPNLARVAVVVSWFGSDLRAGACRVEPKVEDAAKATTGDLWQVAGRTRAGAAVMSTAPDGTPAFGGTPSDAGLTRLVAELARRGLQAVLYPFVMMDVPHDNALPDPHGAAAQPPYPWRGRITCHPAPGMPGSPDGSAEAAAQVAAFFAGPEGYRRQVLHYAGLAAGWAAAGTPLAGFVIGSELVGLTRVRGASGYPAVDALRALAADARAVLGPAVPLVYAADWTEYGAHVREGGAEIRFPLDPLFADPNIAAVGIDYYPPLTDWRDAPGHADADLADTLYDRAYLTGSCGRGEAFDWYYPDAAARAAQERRPITDGAHGKPWLYRAKDLVGWWSNRHVERVGGVETGATPWMPGAKPIWLTEIGVPAVDKGTNGPNVFPDPKSSESAVPPGSTGGRDELIQLRGLEAILTRFDPAAPGFTEAHNPVSPVYGGRMVDPAAIFVWAWDARPFPAFPETDAVWADTANWRVGHWITGRIEGCDLDRLVAAILADLGVDVPARVEAAAFLDGYVIDRPLSARAALEPLAQLYGLDVSAVAGTLRLRGPRRETALVLAEGDLVRVGEAAPLAQVRAEESALPRSVELGFTDSESPGYRRATAAAARPAGGRRRESRVEAAIVARRASAEALAEAVLDRAVAGRDIARLVLSPRLVALEPGDLVALPAPRAGGPALQRVTRIDDGPAGRRVETRGVPLHGPGPLRRAAIRLGGGVPAPALPGPPFCAVLDLPTEGAEPAALQWLAVAADPWPGAVAVWRGAGTDGPLALHRTLDHPACLGRTLSALPPGPLWRIDRAARLDVTLRHAGALASLDEAAWLSGGNTFAVVAPDGTVEILSAARATLTAPETWRLARMLRGLGNSEAAAARGAPAGSLIVRLDGGAVVPLVDRLDEAGRSFRYRIGPAARDPGDPAFAELTAAAGLGAFRPLGPVHLRARREAAGIRLSWIRRARRAADSWEPAEIPLDEPEAYRVAILGADGRALRETATPEPALLYAAAAEIADFGAAQTALTVAVVQVGALTGPGEACRARVPVRAG